MRDGGRRGGRGIQAFTRARAPHDAREGGVRRALASDADGGSKARGVEGGSGAASLSSSMRAIETLVLWLDDHADVFTAGDVSNGGRIMAPDPEAGGVLVPSRLLR